MTIASIDKNSAFECSLALAKGEAYVGYQVSALDDHGNSLRHSNIILPCTSRFPRSMP